MRGLLRDVATVVLDDGANTTRHRCDRLLEDIEFQIVPFFKDSLYKLLAAIRTRDATVDTILKDREEVFNRVKI